MNKTALAKFKAHPSFPAIICTHILKEKRRG
jgi:hypothetical protein